LEHLSNTLAIENKIDIYDFRVLLGDFNVPGVDWKLGIVSIIFLYYNKVKGEANILPCVYTLLIWA
jgi:hypothetical protein